MLLVLAFLAACTPDPTDTGPLPQPGEFMAGFAKVRIPAPVGIGTAGYGPAGSDSDSPYTDIYPATTRIHGPPEVKVTVLSRGPGFETVLISADTVGIFQQLRRALVLDLGARLGRDMDDAVIWGATHTHSGPGRMVDAGGPFDLIADRFFPEFYERFMDDVGDAVEAAYADLTPATLATAVAQAPDGHNDRRCEDGGPDYTNDALPMLVVSRAGQIDGLVIAYPVHGTVLGNEDLTLSGDVAGAIEEAVEDGFDHPVLVSLFNSWGADMSPGDPALDPREGAEQPGGYDRMEAIGAYVAAQVHAALPSDPGSAEPELAARTFRVPIDREAIGYDDETFDYEYGAVYCGMNSEADCDAATTIDDLDEHCVRFNEDYPAPTQTLFTVGRIGELAFTTFTGEPGTRLAEQIMDGMRAHGDVGDVMFLGYTQDYLGYSILEDDWWQGGYEASGALWGPEQGDYLAELDVQAFDAFEAGGAIGPEPAPVAPFEIGEYDPVVPATAVTPGTVLADVAASYGPTEVVTFTLAGEDPWLGPPVATLQTAAGEAVLRPGGEPADSDTYLFWVDLAVEPAWGEEAASRTFGWTFSMPVAHHYSASDPGLSGDYRLRVAVPRADGSTSEVLSGVFTVSR
ncbi:MAG: neutral/alkaline non-lysosomal ceramidase N-terminal domain-containing protein [Pseudomonadota bacterium]